MTYIIGIILVIAVMAFIILFALGQKDIKYVQKSGGLFLKYKLLIDRILSNEKLKLIKNHPNNIVIGYSFVGGGFVRFVITEMSRSLMIRYTTKDNINGEQSLGWKFSETMDQDDMFDKISRDMFVRVLIQDGVSHNEAVKIYLENTQST